MSSRRSRFFTRFTLILGLALTAAGIWRWQQRAEEAAPISRNSPAAIAVPQSAPTGGVAEQTEARIPIAALNRLFTYTQTSEAETLNQALPAPAQEVRYVTIDRQMIEGKQSPFWQAPGVGQLTIPLADGGSLDIRIDRTETLGPNRFTSTGRIAGHPESRAVFAYNEGFLHAEIEDPTLGAWELRAATGELEQFFRVDPALVPECGGGLTPVIDANAITELTRRQASDTLSGTATPSTGGTIAADTSGTNVVVDLMMLYTQAVLSTVTDATQRQAAIQSAFDLAVGQLNDDLIASDVAAQVRLVRIAEVNYPGDDLTTPLQGWQQQMLIAEADPSDGIIDGIHALRDESGADIVCLVQQRLDQDPTTLSINAGIAYIFSSDPYGHRFNPLFAFAVVRYPYLNSEHVFSHEVGHLFGCVHDRDNADPTKPGAFSFSYGYRYTTATGGQYRDIMAYGPGYTRLGYFSTPLVKPPQSPDDAIGIAPLSVLLECEQGARPNPPTTPSALRLDSPTKRTPP